MPQGLAGRPWVTHPAGRWACSLLWLSRSGLGESGRFRFPAQGLEQDVGGRLAFPPLRPVSLLPPCLLISGVPTPSDSCPSPPKLQLFTHAEEFAAALGALSSPVLGASDCPLVLIRDFS